MPTQVAIDGPAGVGKSTVASRVAGILDLPYLNTGQLYRAVGFLVVRVFNQSPDDADFATQIALSLEPQIVGGMVASANNYRMGEKLKADDISDAASRVSKHHGVREALLDLQRAEAELHGAVMEGRDIGTVVLPYAQHKFFLVCDPQERVRRRLKDGNRETVQELLARDQRDSSRESAPLKKAADAMEIDTTHLTIEQVVDLIVRKVKTG